MVVCPFVLFLLVVMLSGFVVLVTPNSEKIITMSVMYQTNTMSWIYIVLAYWNTNP
jgi:hypothetical protein